MVYRMGKRAMYQRADIDVDSIGVTYFPFPESVTQIAYSCGSQCTGMLFRGNESYCLYVGGPYTSTSNGYDMREMFGNRERAIVERLSHVEVIESGRDNGHKHAVVAFVSRGGERFTVVTNDYGRTWDICG